MPTRDPARRGLESAVSPQKRWQEQSKLARTKSLHPAPRSLEHLQEWAFVASLDPMDPFSFIDEIQHMNRQRVLLDRDLHPNGTRRAGNDHRQRSQAVRIVQVQWNVDEPGRDFPPARQTQYDTCNADVGAHHIYEHMNEQSHKT